LYSSLRSWGLLPSPAGARIGHRIIPLKLSGRLLKWSSSHATWSNSIPNAKYSLLTGPIADKAFVTTYFSSPVSSDFTLDFVLWNGNKVSERQEFKWDDGHWDSVYGTLLTNGTGGFDPGKYDRTSTIEVSSTTPVPATVFLLGPALLLILYARRRWAAAN
jgi:hypothetical protein